ncbi:hypothetical protein N5O83_04740 [Ectopseudomonas oleovorans]|uniref:Uncharacterized protein n=1 Tax=Ectopseudomonas oleovorans TaxID=301 RepID=A0AA42TUF0_ECTOL|nr:hypothetical protein [Pseudomonas oleovorans]MDH1340142.1 hypothetical protein [Pseudomonas oleovorans]MDH1494369.1 hypothetical protein [Pseudomonas oleovorans]WGG22003.1 hypothetical protein N5O83_04740 [Pseudomonas oleovorans]
MTNQLKTFLSGLLYQLVDLRMHSRELRGQYQDWSKWGRISGRIDLAAELGLISHDQWVDLHRLLSSASDCLGMPFPHQGNAGPLMPLIVAHDRRQAAAESPVQAVSFDAVPAVTCMGGYDFVDAGQVKPPVQAAEPVAVEAGSKPKEGWGKPYLARKAHYFINGQSICNRWLYTGAVVNRLLVSSFGCSACKRLLAVKPQAQDSANEKPEPVSAPTSRRELRLLCVLVKPQLGSAEGAYLPIHTMHRLPPREMVKGQWSEPRYSGLHLRETQARQPSAEVLERCLPKRHLRTNGRLSVLGGTV